ncbi:hypothetical protein Tco_0592596 [Tanacetum coccineum]
MLKYSTSWTPDSSFSLWELSSFRIISINIMSPSSSLVQTSSALGDGGTNPSDSKSELNLRTFSVMNEIYGSGGIEESECHKDYFARAEGLYTYLPASSASEIPSSVELDFQARLDGGRMYSGHLEAKRLP